MSLPDISALEARALATTSKTMLDACVQPNPYKGGYAGFISCVPLHKLSSYRDHRYWHIMDLYHLVPAYTLGKEEIEDLREVITIIIADCMKPKPTRKLRNPITGEVFDV
tara:strand:+ start:1611 stop:1940 length:330 start_codon:yes stop_codon:yes gene_type:complete